MKELRLIETGVPNLDSILDGGMPTYSFNIIAGLPGTGKTVLAQQILFNYIFREEDSVGLYITTLSEPTVKMVRYMQRFSFFEENALGTKVIYHDIGRFIRDNPLKKVADYIVSLVEEYKPGMLVIDSFKAIHDIAIQVGEFRYFCYDLSVRLASARSTTILVGEYNRLHIHEGVEFAIADGIIYLDITQMEGKQQRSIQILKLRGMATDVTSSAFTITSDGIRILKPGITLKERKALGGVEKERLETGIEGLDALLLGGIQRGRSLLLSGISGTGKTTLSLHSLVQNANKGRRGLFFSLEESHDHLYSIAESFGWDIKKLEDRGALRIVALSGTYSGVEENIEEVFEEVYSFQPYMIVIDPLSALLHKIKELSIQRDKTFQLISLIQKVGSVGILISDIPASDPRRLSRFGVEETVVDGIIILSSHMEGMKRRRYIEVYKMRATDHIPGRHRMDITDKGIEVFYTEPLRFNGREVQQPSLIFNPLKPMLPEGVRYGSAWLIQGEQGLGKSTIAYQFALEGLKRKESVLFIASDNSTGQVIQEMEGWGILIRPFIESGHLVILDANPSSIETEGIDLTDPERFIYTINKHLKKMPIPSRIVMDSLTSLSMQYTPEAFVAFIERKNRFFNSQSVAVFDTILTKTLKESSLYRLINNYDVVIDLYIPNWGEMGQAGRRGGRL